VKRGDVWTVAGGKDHAGKPRPVVIVQDDSFDATDSITICASRAMRPKRLYFGWPWSQTSATVCWYVPA